MKKTLLISLFSILFIFALSLSIFYIRSHDIPVLEPKGWIALQQKELIIVCSLLMSIVVIPVFMMTILFSWRYRAGKKGGEYQPEWGHSFLAECIWWGVPFVIIAALAWITWDSTHQLNPFKPIAAEVRPLKIQVVALDWKWLFIYPEEGIATVNYVQFPKETPLAFEITSDAPMNSFWIPALGGQIYAMPGMRTKLHLIATEEGEFRGSSSNISGTGFAGMVFQAVSTSRLEFDRWVSQVRRENRDLSQKSYNLLVQPSQYHPVTYYSIVEEGLFDQIVMKYMQR